MTKSGLFSKKFLFFGGKGGVGKTTMAAATAIHAADLGIRTLIVSTDPAHSVADSLNQQIGGDTYTPVQGVANLSAIELDTQKTMSDYSSILSQQDPSGLVSDFLGGDDPNALSPPGADETVAFIQLMSYIQNPEFDLVVFDTAPTGHTLKLLQLPELTQGWLFRLIKMRRRLGGLMSGVKTLFGGGAGPSEEEAFEKLEELRDQVEVTRKYLSNAQDTEFIAVTIPTLMAMYETERLIRALFDVAFPISKIYINQIQPENPDCSYCRARFTNQADNLKQIQELYSDFDLVEIQMHEHEIRGIEALRNLSTALYGVN